MTSDMSVAHGVIDLMDVLRASLKAEKERKVIAEAVAKVAETRDWYEVHGRVSVKQLEELLEIAQGALDREVERTK